MPTPIVRNTVVLQPRKKKAGFILDEILGSVAAYSLRRLRTAYTGNAIRVRRSSDNAEQDIGFDSSGNLDTSALKTFIGANSGFVTKWYDQSGGTRDASQSTAGSQPRIVDAGTIDVDANGKPRINFWPDTVQRLLTYTYTHNQPLTICTSTQWLDLSAQTTALFKSQNGGLFVDAGRTNGGVIRMTAGGYVYTTNTTDTNFRIITYLYNTTSSKIYIDGTLNGSGNVGSYNGGTTGTLGSAFKGTISEFILFNYVLPESNILKLNNNQKLFYNIS